MKYHFNRLFDAFLLTAGFFFIQFAINQFRFTEDWMGLVAAVFFVSYFIQVRSGQ